MGEDHELWSVSRIARPVEPISQQLACGEALDRLMSDPDLPGLPVWEQGQVQGLAARNHLLQVFANPLHRATCERRPVRLLMDRDPLVVQADWDVDIVSEKMVAKHRKALQEGFVILRGEAYIGMGSAHDLLDLAVAKARRRVWEIDRARTEAISASNAKSDFLAGMSHELRTPLNAILGFSQMLELDIGGTLPPRQREYVQHIRSSGMLLLDLVNDVLDLSRVEAQRTVLDEERVSLREIVDKCLSRSRPHIDAKRHRVTVNCASRAIDIRADARRIEQILVNLVTNALKYTPDDGDIRVTLDVDREGRPGFRVTDNGIGIAKENLNRILEPFGRVETAYVRATEGSGIGLSLAKKLIELHGGTLEITSALGHGTVVEVRFPVDRLMADVAATCANTH